MLRNNGKDNETKVKGERRVRGSRGRERNEKGKEGRGNPRVRGTSGGRQERGNPRVRGRCVERREETSTMGQEVKWRPRVWTAGGRQRIWVSPYIYPPFKVATTRRDSLR